MYWELSVSFSGTSESGGTVFGGGGGGWLLGIVHTYVHIYVYTYIYIYIRIIVCIYVGISQKGWVSFFFVGGGVLDLMMDGWMVVLWMGLMEVLEGVDGWERGFWWDGVVGVEEEEEGGVRRRRGGMDIVGGGVGGRDGE